jgi:ABC-type polysaccharide/polyol phosphate transport system ATPase subunit
MDKDIAIKVENVSKTFKIPHEKISSIRGAAVNAFKRSSFEEFNALENVSFEIKKGEFFGIIGGNGSGKSTLLKILAGIYQADKGKVHINGRISPFLELGIGFNPELSGRDNVYLNAAVLGLTKKEIDEKFDSIVKFSELERFIDQKLKNYSSGMQVRLAFAVSIHANREILLMDEVLAVGDSNFQKKCIEEFEKYKISGKTVILVSHDIEIIKEYCDRALLLNNGIAVMLGNSRDVVNRYIDENIKKEEQRIETENEISKELFKLSERGFSPSSEFSRNGNGKAVIESFKVFNDEGRETVTLETNKAFKIQVKVLLNDEIENLVFGAMFRKNQSENLFGINTLYRDDPTVFGDVQKNSSVLIEVEDIMTLTPGTYHLSLSCVSQFSYLRYDLLDSLENVIKINVNSKIKYWGLINTGRSNINIKKNV